MRFIFGLVLVVGFGLAGFAVYITKGYLSNYQAEEQKSLSELKRLQAIVDGIVKTADVYVLTKRIRYGERLTKDHLRTIKWPVDSLPKGVFTTPPQKTEDGKPGQELFIDGSPKLRSAFRTMVINEPVLAEKVSRPGQRVGVTTFLSPGMRAYTFNVSTDIGGSAFLRPEDRIDISWIGEDRVLGKTVIQKVANNVRLIAVDQSADDERAEGASASNVTVEITPTQVKYFALAQKKGQLQISLVKSAADGSTHVDDGRVIVIDDVIILTEEAAREEAREEVVDKKCYTIVTKGTERTKVEMDCPSQ